MHKARVKPLVQCSYDLAFASGLWFLVFAGVTIHLKELLLERCMKEQLEMLQLFIIPIIQGHYGGKTPNQVGANLNVNCEIGSIIIGCQETILMNKPFTV